MAEELKFLPHNIIPFKKLASNTETLQIDDECIDKLIRRTNSALTTLKSILGDHLLEKRISREEYEFKDFKNTLNSENINKVSTFISPIHPYILSPTNSESRTLVLSPRDIDPKIITSRPERLPGHARNSSNSEKAYELNSISQSLVAVVPISKGFIGQTEWNKLMQLTHFNKVELSKLNKVFSLRQVDGLISKASFWELISISRGFNKESLFPKIPAEIENNDNALRSFVLSDANYIRVYVEGPSLLSSRMFSIFDVMKRNSLTFLEFALAFALLCGKTDIKFLNLVDFSFDVFDLHQDQVVTLEELLISAKITNIYNKWPTHLKKDAYSTNQLDLDENLAYINAVSEAQVHLYTKAFESCVTNGLNYLTRDIYKDMIIKYPAILDIFTIYYQDFIDNISITVNLQHNISNSP